MRTLKRIKTVNLQSHKEVVIDLPKTGLVRFSGDNSNGKSVIPKVTKYLISGMLGNPKYRNSLVSKWAMSGEIHYEAYDGYKFLCHLQRDAAGTYIELTRPNGEVIRRYASEKKWGELILEFGFFYNKETDITLNVSDEDTPSLYIATNPKATYSLLTSVITDPVAERSLENMQQLYAEALSTKQEAVKQKQVYSSAMEKFETCDEEALEKVVEDIDRMLKSLEGIYEPEIQDFPDMTPVNFYNVYKPKIPDFPDMAPVHFYTVAVPKVGLPPYPKFYEIHKPAIPDMTNLLGELDQMRKGVCPTCGRPLIQEVAHAC